MVEAAPAPGYRRGVHLQRLALIVSGAVATAIIAAVCAMPHDGVRAPAPWLAIELSLLATYAAGLVLGRVAWPWTLTSRT